MVNAMGIARLLMSYPDLWDLNAAAWIATTESIEKGHLTLSVLRRADQEFLEFSRFDELGLNRMQAGKGLAERIDASRWRIANDRGEQIQHFGGTLPTRRPVQP